MNTMNLDLTPLNIHVRKAAVNNSVYDMIEYEDYYKNRDAYIGKGNVAIHDKSDTGKDILLPLRDKYPANGTNVPGVYNAGNVISFIVKPQRNEEDKYVASKIADFSSEMNIQEIIKSGEEASKLDEMFITTADNITSIPISEYDQPEMKCLKSALNEKQIDIDKYGWRFGDNFPNDKRQLKNHSATLNIIKRYCKNCDMEALLTLRDTSGSVPNPIGREITVSLTNDFVDGVDVENIDDDYTKTKEYEEYNGEEEKDEE